MEKKCPKHLTREEILRIIEKERVACLTVFKKEDMRAIPVCYNLKCCNDNLIFEVKAKEDHKDLECLKSGEKVLLEIERKDENDCKKHEKCVETVFVIGVVKKDECEFEKQKWEDCDKQHVVEICVLEIFGRKHEMCCPKFRCELVCEDDKKEEKFEKEEKYEKKHEEKHENKCENKCDNHR